METFTATNRARIAALLLASVANSFVTAVLVGAALGIALVIWALGQGGELPSTGHGWEYLGIPTAIVAGLGAVLALLVSLVTLPRARRDLESGMLSSPSITIVDDATGFNRRFARRLRAWALRGTAAARDRAAIAMSKNPMALLAALEGLVADPRVVPWIQPETAALWIEVPDAVARRNGDGPPDPTLMAFSLRERIAAVRTWRHCRAPDRPPIELFIVR